MKATYQLQTLKACMSVVSSMLNWAVAGIHVSAIALLIFWGLISNVQAFEIQDFNVLAPPDSVVEVDVIFYINKVYNVDSVAETYQIDGYLVFVWQDERLSFSPDSLPSVLIFENEKAQDLMKSDVWVPAFEFNNIQGSQETQNIQITIYPDGIITYEERFFGVFHTEMDFKRFPFDSKTFVVEIEPFSYDTDLLRFNKSYLFPDEYSNMNLKLGKDWVLTGTQSRLDSTLYPQPAGSEIGFGPSIFSKVVFEVQADRRYGYYLWQVLFPLFIIILASFTIFWIQDFGTQMGIGFSLMLTVVAFNFYSASILPKLPYNTFIEYVIMVGYIFIFLGIIAATINHNLLKAKRHKFDLLKICRGLFPLVYLLIMIVLVVTNFLV
jgi:hypothetical protein